MIDGLQKLNQSIKRLKQQLGDGLALNVIGTDGSISDNIAGALSGHLSYIFGGINELLIPDLLTDELVKISKTTNSGFTVDQTGGAEGRKPGSKRDVAIKFTESGYTVGISAKYWKMGDHSFVRSYGSQVVRSLMTTEKEQARYQIMNRIVHTGRDHTNAALRYMAHKNMQSLIGKDVLFMAYADQLQRIDHFYEDVQSNQHKWYLGLDTGTGALPTKSNPEGGKHNQPTGDAPDAFHAWRRSKDVYNFILGVQGRLIAKK
jgi:hypothetical protein